MVGLSDASGTTRGTIVPLTRIKQVLLISAGVLATLAGLGWGGLQVRPAAFPAVGQRPPAPETVPLPAGLPAPVERFYRQTYGERVPVIRSAVVSGRGTLRLGGVTFPVRFRFTHDAGRSFRAYFELTAFGVPVMKVDEHYVDGTFRQEGTPDGVVQGDPKFAQGANVRMWAEYLSWFPAALLTDPRVRWEPIDDATALLVIPFGEERERFVVRFDPATGGVQYWEVMRYQGADATAKTLWINGAWFDEGRPWAVWNVEDKAYNVPVDTALTAKGP